MRTAKNKQQPLQSKLPQASAHKNIKERSQHPIKIPQICRTLEGLYVVCMQIMATRQYRPSSKQDLVHRPSENGQSKFVNMKVPSDKGVLCTLMTKKLGDNFPGSIHCSNNKSLCIKLHRPTSFAFFRDRPTRERHFN